MAKKLKDALEEKYGKQGRVLVYENGVYLRSGRGRTEDEMREAAKRNRYRD